MSAKQNTEKTFLVLGSNGKTGSRVVKQLLEKKYKVRIGSRSAEISFDWEDVSTWKPVLKDVDTVYITFQPDLALPGSVETIASFSKIAVASGVKKLVLLSGRGEPEAQECEQAVIRSGADWTIVRASWFCQNFSEGNFLEPIIAGYVALPAGNVREPFIDTDDIADVVSAALTDDKHNGHIYEVTGPRLLTFKEAVIEIAAASGKTIHYEEISIDHYKATLAEYNVPNVIINLITYLFTEVLDGRNESITDGVERALARKPRDFSEYAKRATESGVWNTISV
ncbi:NmrA family NAD(P)-binding protein [Flavobacterium cerinum]|uniref:NmrA family transcriptional regulator n=1 Tax=Flavobacterium cerinum TaxID=2502784 RepID=A0A444HAZ4_9FLAO|nr:NAD(P)H-binding protein [Flavobacterium cerinum]RWX00416.1 NmrA family transcriptional regulator [Flavobacterium cerinum]